MFSTLKYVLWVLIIESVVCAFELSALPLNQLFLFIMFEFCDDWTWVIAVVLVSDPMHAVKSDIL